MITLSVLVMMNICTKYESRLYLLGLTYVYIACKFFFWFVFGTMFFN